VNQTQAACATCMPSTMTDVVPVPSHTDIALYAYRKHKAARKGLHNTKRHAGA